MGDPLRVKWAAGKWVWAVLLLSACGTYVPLNTGAMYPTLSRRGECRLETPAPPPERGHVVLLDIDGRPTLRRIVAVAGDDVEVRGGALHVNGQAAFRRVVAERALCRVGVSAHCRCRIEAESVGGRDVHVQRIVPGNDARCPIGPDFPKRTVRPGYVTVLADNRDAALDSRALGDFTVSKLKARVLACRR